MAVMQHQVAFILVKANIYTLGKCYNLVQGLQDEFTLSFCLTKFLH